MENLTKKLQIGSTLIVKGWIRLKGLDAGCYVIMKEDDYSYTFRKARGRKPICRHYKRDIEFWIGNSEVSDNGIIVR